MRIDYSSPRRSSTAAPSTGKQRSSSAGSKLFTVMILLITGSVMFGTGFGTGWYFSQQATKRAFRDAMEQSSLENYPASETGSAASSLPPVMPVITADKPVVTSATPSESVSDSSSSEPSLMQPKQEQESKPESTRLSFYDNLSSGQKNIVLGSGINEKPRQTDEVVPVITDTSAPKTAERPAPQSEQSQPLTSSTPVVQPPKNTAWVVQVAAFPALSDAEALKARLAAKGYTASVMETKLDDRGTWYRVRIGRNMSQEAATDIANRIGGGAKAIPDKD